MPVLSFSTEHDIALTSRQPHSHTTEADDLEDGDPRRSYIFDLDSHQGNDEDEDDATTSNLQGTVWSVDSHKCGTSGGTATLSSRALLTPKQRQLESVHQASYQIMLVWESSR